MDTTKIKSNSTVTTIVDGGQILFSVIGAGSVTLDTAKVSQVVKDLATMHGFKQRISDRAAISRNPETGLAASPQDKLEAMKELVEFYHLGGEDWSMRKAGGERQTGGLLVQCLIALYADKTPERVREYVKGLSK